MLEDTLLISLMKKSINMPKPKRHHYLPQFYLNGFCTNGRLWIYDRTENNFRCQTPINTGVIKDYYTFLDEEENKDTKIEEMLSKVEGDTKPVIDKIDKTTFYTLKTGEQKHRFNILLNDSVYRELIMSAEKQRISRNQLVSGILENNFKKGNSVRDFHRA